MSKSTRFSQWKVVNLWYLVFHMSSMLNLSAAWRAIGCFHTNWMTFRAWPWEKVSSLGVRCGNQSIESFPLYPFCDIRSSALSTGAVLKLDKVFYRRTLLHCLGNAAIRLLLKVSPCGEVIFAVCAWIPTPLWMWMVSFSVQSSNSLCWKVGKTCIELRNFIKMHTLRISSNCLNRVCGGA